MSNQLINITDPARELFDLGTELKAIKQNKNYPQTYIAIAEYVGLEPNSAQLIELFAAVTSRLSRLSDIAQNLHDAHLHDDHKKNIASACSTFGQLFHPQYLSTAWEDAKKRFLADALLNSFLWFSPIIRSTKPLKKLSVEERDAALVQVAETIEAIEAANEASWIREPLLDGLRHLQFTLRHLYIFGHEIAQNQILLLEQKARLLDSKDAQFDEPSNQRLSILKTLNVIAVVGTLFCLPDQFLTAVPHYRDLLLPAAVQESELKQERRLLPAPKDKHEPEPSKDILEPPDANKRKSW